MQSEPVPVTEKDLLSRAESGNTAPGSQSQGLLLCNPQFWNDSSKSGQAQDVRYSFHISLLHAADSTLGYRHLSGKAGRFGSKPPFYDFPQRLGGKLSPSKLISQSMLLRAHTYNDP
ncbi:hypothetical protein STEG23_004196, partial [Scotinomys teguina]